MTAALDPLIVAEKDHAKAAADGVTATFRTDRALVIGLLVGGVLFALALKIAVARSIKAGLSSVEEVCEGLSEGDLTVTAGLTNNDEVGRMGRSLDTALGSLRGEVTTIDTSSGSQSLECR